MGFRNSCKCILVLTVLTVFCAWGFAQAQATGWSIVALTNGINISRLPSISESYVVWESLVDGQYEVSLHKKGARTTTQLTGSDYGNTGALISGFNVAWLGGRCGNPFQEVFLYNILSKTATQLTDSSTTRYNGGLDISGNDVVWYSADFIPRQSFIFQYGRTAMTITELASASYPDSVSFPRISDNNVVWQYTADSQDTELYLNSERLTYNDYNDLSHKISASNVAWAGQVDDYGNDWEIFFHNGIETRRLTKNAFNDELPRVSGSNVIWQGWDGNDWEIFFFEGIGGDIVQLTDNESDEMYARISGLNVVWQYWDGNDWEIVFHDGFAAVQLTNNDYDDCFPRISGSNIVWTVYNDPLNGQIYMASPDIPITLSKPYDGKLAVISWPASPQYRYRLWGTNDLANWTVKGNWIEGATGIINHVDFNYGLETSYYRVERQNLPEQHSDSCR